MDMQNFFGMPDNAEAPAEAVRTVANPKKEKNTEMISKFKQAISSDQTLVGKLKSKSNNIAVVNVLSSTKIQNLIDDKANPKIDENGNKKRNLVPVPGICGYAVKNIGNEPIEYKTEEYTAGEDGVYVGTPVTRTCAPGEVMLLQRKYFTLLTCLPEYSFTLANGTVVGANSVSNKAVTLDEKLEIPHFKFSVKEDGTTISVHDDSVKVPVEGPDGKVTDQYKLYFGYLDNPTVAKTRKTGGSTKYSTQEIAANYFRMLVEEAGASTN